MSTSDPIGEPTDEEMNELADWIATRPPAVVAMMDLFPPGSFVRAKEGRSLLAPAPGKTGQVVSYEHNPDTDAVTLRVEAEDALLPFVWKAECEPDWLEVVDSDQQREWYERAKAMIDRVP